MLKKIALSGSCYWCMEAIFQSLKGVIHVNQGWIAEKSPPTDIDSQDSSPPFYEAIMVKYDSGIIPTDVLIDIHIHSHSSTRTHSLRHRYPSAVYTQTHDERLVINELLQQKNAELNGQLLTQARIIGHFKPSQQSMQDYFYNNPEKPFCQNIISPKLKKLLSEFGQWVSLEKADKIHSHQD